MGSSRSPMSQLWGADRPQIRLVDINHGYRDISAATGIPLSSIHRLLHTPLRSAKAKARLAAILEYDRTGVPPSAKAKGRGGI